MKTQIESTKCRQETTVELPQPLTEQDWEEIYYALESKLTSPASMGDAQWRKHLRKIIQKIGPDGRTAFESQQPSFREALEFCLTFLTSAAMLNREAFNSCAWETLRDAAKNRADFARSALADCEIPTPGCEGDKVETEAVDQANAELIVRAVNSHAILLDALKEMVSLHSGQEYLYGLTASGAKLYRDTDTAARYAIKLAQGGTCEIPTPGCAGDKVEIGL